LCLLIILLLVGVELVLVQLLVAAVQEDTAMGKWMFLHKTILLLLGEAEESWEPKEQEVMEQIVLLRELLQREEAGAREVLAELLIGVQEMVVRAVEGKVIMEVQEVAQEYLDKDLREPPHPTLILLVGVVEQEDQVQLTGLVDQEKHQA
jgi:hypothetical protein